MITRIEIDGFKSFQNFAVDLRPFQVLIGANGVGKSNLFDAVVLLSHLANSNSLYEAFRANRGDIGELFTVLPDRGRVLEMRFAVEMLIDRQVTDEFGVTADVTSTRVRYEIGIERRRENGFERLYVTHEALNAITEDNDKWFRTNVPPKTRKRWIVRGRRSPYISTEAGVVSIHQDKRAGGRLETPVGKVERSLLSTIASAEYPTAYAVRQEMMNWRFLQFNPEVLRLPSHIYALTDLLPDGSNLAAVLHRMSREDEHALTDVSIDIANLVPGLLKISVEVLQEREQFLIYARAKDESILSSRVLSDGTLRILGLATLKNDPRQRGVLCLEEPENGVTPERLSAVAELLQTIPTDFDDETNASEPLRQILINTHSTNLLKHIDLEDILFVFMVERQPRLTRIGYVTGKMFDYEEKSLTYYTLSSVRRYLEEGKRPSALEQQVNDAIEASR